MSQAGFSTFGRVWKGLQPSASLLTAVVVLGVSGIAWGTMVSSMRSMSPAAMIGHGSTAADVLRTVPMWTSMLVAMMLPIATAPIISCSRVMGGRAAPLSGISFTTGYLASCVAFALAAAVAGGLLHPNASRYESALGLALVGVYQWMPMKLRALAMCKGALFKSRVQGSQAPIRDFYSGAAHAGSCFKCCGAAMLAPLFSGMTNLSFMVFLFAWMLLEQAGWLSAGFTRLIGTAWVAAGFLLGGSLHVSGFSAAAAAYL